MSRRDQVVDFALLLPAVLNQLCPSLERRRAHASLETQAHARVSAQAAVFEQPACCIEYNHVLVSEQGVPHYRELWHAGSIDRGHNRETRLFQKRTDALRRRW